MGSIRVGMTEDRINELKDRTIKFTPSEQQRQNEKKEREKVRERKICGTVTTT